MRNPVNVRRTAVAAITPLLLVGLAACGGDAETAATDLAAASSGSDPSSAASEIDPQEFVDRMTASFDNTTTARVTMEMTASGADLSATGQLDYSGDTPAMSMEMTMPAMGAGTIEMRLIDEVMYMSMPMIDPSGKFFKIDLNDPNNPLGDSIDPDSMDPQSTMKDFGKGAKSVKLIGEESLDGQDVTHYQVLSSTKGLNSSAVGSTAPLPKTFTYDIWFDDEDRVVKMTAIMGKQSTVDMVMTNFGEPVDIKAPPASQIQVMPGT